LLFTQLFFWGFFLVVLTGYSVLFSHNRLRSVYLLAVSLFFYFKTSGIFVVLLLFTICSDYFWGQKIYRSRSSLHRKLYLTISVMLNLLLLCYFKYAYFFNESFNTITGSQHRFFNHFAAFSNTFFSSNFSVDQLILPVGISFFTFQSLSYVVDMYRSKITPVKSIFDYGFFVCFFPHLVAGPIVKAHDFLYQIYQPYKLTKFEFGMAFFWIINGFCKKIIADYIAVNYVDRIFDNPNFYTGVETIIGIFGYSLQIYMDFSGYTDMAIGLALILGYRLKTNFNSPYKATSPGEFWKRWHISLSSWLQEYLYIPLGGNRNGSVGSYICISVIVVFLVLLSGKPWLLAVLAFLVIFFVTIAYFSRTFRHNINTNINLMVTMLLGGLWHGSSWLFIIWGGLNGLGIMVQRLWSRISPFKYSAHLAVKGVMMLLTLCFISFTRIFFRSPTLEVVNSIFDRISNHLGADLFVNIIAGYKFVFFLILFGYIVHWIPESAKVSYRSWFASRNYGLMATIAVILIFIMYQLMSGDMQPFIYFQF
jgi:D-alanyl-lipoteichoic acid acyltransferase DltB (MBOAT superfamily)